MIDISKKIVLFGAGKVGKKALQILKQVNKEVVYFLDNDSKKWGTVADGIRIISLQNLLQQDISAYHVMVACAPKNRDSIVAQLKNSNVKDFSVFDETYIWKLSNRETLVSYSHECDIEDVILYHVFHETSNIFYIDVGANDPWLYSVTKMLYDKGAHGINIEPIQEIANLYLRERPRDIIVCAGVGAEKTTKTLFLQGSLSGGSSTVVEDNIIMNDAKQVAIDMYPLKEICNKYISNNQEIHFLKIDVEGAEKEVLLGSDFAIYRPWCVVMESTLPGTDIPCYAEWESLLLGNAYHFVFSHGVNRYYVADEHSELDERFIPVENLLNRYRIFRAEQVS